MDEQLDNNWHLDKKVPMGIIIAIIIQTLTLVYVGTSWKDSIDARINTLEKSDQNVADAPNRLTILEQKFNFIQSSLSRIEGNQSANLSRIESKIDKIDKPDNKETTQP